jgi:hypothetical protein
MDWSILLIIGIMVTVVSGFFFLVQVMWRVAGSDGPLNPHQKICYENCMDFFENRPEKSEHCMRNCSERLQINSKDF